MEFNSYTIRRTIFDASCVAYILFCVFIAIQHPDVDAFVANMSTNFYIFVGMGFFGAMVSLLLNANGMKTLGEVIFAPANKRVTEKNPKDWHQTLWGIQAIVTVVLTFAMGVVVTKVNVIALLEKESFDHAMRLFGFISDPNWEILPKAIAKIIETVYIAFMATFLAIPIAFVLSFLCAKNIMGGSKVGMLIYTLLRLIFNISRSIEPILWAIIFSIWVGFGPFAGMMALMIHSISSLSKQYSEIVESVESGPIEGIESTGANRLQTIWFAIVPQVILPHISYTIYRWDINVRMATIIGFVGGGGIGSMLIEYQGQAHWREVGCIIVVISFVVWIMDTFSAYVREAVK